MLLHNLLFTNSYEFSFGSVHLHTCNFCIIQKLNFLHTLRKKILLRQVPGFEGRIWPTSSRMAELFLSISGIDITLKRLDAVDCGCIFLFYRVSSRSDTFRNFQTENKKMTENVSN